MSDFNDKDPQKVSDLLTENQSFSFIVQRAQTLMALQRWLNEVLPKELKPYCQVINIHGSRLLVGTISGAHATRLHYLAPELLQSLHFHNQWRYIQSIEAKVATHR